MSDVTHLVEHRQPGIPRTPDADEEVEQQELSSQLMGMQNSAATLEYSLELSFQTDPAIEFLHIYPEELKAYGEEWYYF